MAELIAQGPETSHHWRRMFRAGERVVLGREAGAWSVSWDAQISRQHAELVWQGNRLSVRRLPTSRNPIFKAGQEQQQFDLAPGEHFVIGQTSFTLLHDRVVTQESP